jgi:hypothetical protein
MKARLETNANITPTNLLSGIISILTGTTDLTALPTGFNTAASTLSTSISQAGWTIHDNAASANSMVIKAPYSDLATAFKYLEIKATSSAIEFYAYETWDNVAHTGTNKTGNTSSYQNQRLQLSQSGRIHVFASSKMITIATEFGTNWGDQNSGVFLAVEHSRIPAWNTAATYPAFSICFLGELLNGSKSAFMPRARKKSGVDALSIESAAYFGSVGISYNQWTQPQSIPTGADAKVLNADGTKTCPFMPIYLTDPVVFSIPLGHCSNADVFLAPKDLLANLETVLKTGTSQEYIALQCSSNGHRLLIPNG